MDNELETLTSEGLSAEDIETIRSGQTSKPNFPFLVFSAAVVKDIADIASGGTVGILISIITTPIIFFYTLGKMGFIKKRLWKRFIFTSLAEVSPFLAFVPVSTFFVLSAHATEYKQIERVLNLVEKVT